MSLSGGRTDNLVYGRAPEVTDLLGDLVEFLGDNGGLGGELARSAQSSDQLLKMRATARSINKDPGRRAVRRRPGAINADEGCAISSRDLGARLRVRARYPSAESEYGELSSLLWRPRRRRVARVVGASAQFQHWKRRRVAFDGGSIWPQ